MTNRKVMKEEVARGGGQLCGLGSPRRGALEREGLQPGPFLLSGSLVLIPGFPGEGRRGRRAGVHSNSRNFFQDSRPPLEGTQFLSWEAESKASESKGRRLPWRESLCGRGVECDVTCGSLLFQESNCSSAFAGFCTHVHAHTLCRPVLPRCLPLSVSITCQL